MISISAKKLAEIVDGKLSNIPEEFVVDQLPIINSKLATNGTFFVAFKGTQADGHDFVPEAIKNGSAFAIVSKSVDAPSVLVKDVGQALLSMANYVRNNIQGLKVVGITGS